MPRMSWPDAPELVRTPRMARPAASSQSLRALFGPEGMLHANFFVRSGDGCDLLTSVIDEEGAGATRAGVYT